MKKWSLGHTDIENVKVLDKNPNTKFSQYILDNYFLISFKVAFYTAAYNVGLTDLDCFKKLSKCFKKRKSEKVVSSAPRRSSSTTVDLKSKNRGCEAEYDGYKHEQNEEVDIA